MLVMNQEAVEMMNLNVGICREAGLLNEHDVLPFGAQLPEQVYRMVVLLRRCGDIQDKEGLAVGAIIREFMRGQYVIQEMVA